MGELRAAITATQPAEWVAVVCAIAYLVLAIRRHIACWAFAFISTAIYTVLFYNVSLLMESALNVYYLVMAVYGWREWRASSEHHVLQEIRESTWRYHALACFGVVVASVFSGSLLTKFTASAFPYIDSLTTWGAVFATWLVARRDIANWYYWLVIDALSVFLFWRSGLALSAVLYALYVVMIPFGLLGWRRVLRRQHANA